MVSLGGLSAVFPGFQEARKTGVQSDLREFELQDLQGLQRGKFDLANTLQQLSMPGAQPIPGGPPPGMAGGGPLSAPGGAGPPPQPPMQPGQASVPMQPMGPMRSGEAMGPPMAPGMQNFPASGGGMLQGGNQRLSQALQGTQPQPPPQMAPPGQPPQGQMPPSMRPPGPQQAPPGGMYDLATAAQAIARTNPGMTPQRLAYALQAAYPYLNMEARQQVAQLRNEMALDREFMRGQTARDVAGTQAGSKVEVAGIVADTAAKKEAGIGGRAQTREERLARQGHERHEEAIARIAQGDRKLDDLRAQRDRATSLAEKRAIIDAMHKHTLDISSTYSDFNKLPAKEKAELRKQIDATYEEELKNLRASAKPPVKVNTPADAQKLDPGTPYVTPDGREYTR